MLMCVLGLCVFCCGLCCFSSSPSFPSYYLLDGVGVRRVCACACMNPYVFIYTYTYVCVVCHIHTRVCFAYHQPVPPYTSPPLLIIIIIITTIIIIILITTTAGNQ